MSVRTPLLATTVQELTRARDAMTGPVAVVMTMGALHEGHVALLRQARARGAHLIATLFVNPLQFGPSEDFDRYPRTRERDLEIFAREQVDVVFAPTIEELYPGGPPNVRVDPGPLGAILEGASRPGFFHGVLTVVLKLLHLTRPGAAFFGEKDYQQLALIRAMVTDFDLDVEIVGVPTVREPDGLARSSRNAYLYPAQRQAAVALSRALYAGAAAGPYGAEAVRSAARAELTGVDLDYLALTDPGLGPTPAHGAARLLVAARVGRTRLIDNAAVVLSARPGA
ncbi:MAG: pantoate--beta-alanine ligase [Actinomycetota bacterium]|nr:pantoate--beta-alanine ligase [Actinomycetota bacterium]